MKRTPIVDHDTTEAPVFEPGNLLDGARRQKGRAGSVELSPVLAAMGVPPREGLGAVRFSLGRTTTWEELEQVLSALEHHA